MSVVGLLVVVGVLVAATVVELVRRRRAGRVRAASAQSRVSADRLGVDELGRCATLLQFSSAFCRPCVATRHVLNDVAGRVDGVRHVDVDAESHLELVRELGITSTPTTLLLDAAGVVRKRAPGVPRKDEVLAALGELVSG
jgi:thiol-disulfide isomerase/thioredoxin